jgi:hypothetical protein
MHDHFKIFDDKKDLLRIRALFLHRISKFKMAI